MDLRLTFDQDELNYDRYRPTYTAALFDDLIAYAGLDGSCQALEIGIGTGQATRPILETGCRVTAIELGGKLAAFCRAKFEAYSAFQVINADFQDFAGESGAYDLVYSATAFHWIPRELGLPKALDLLKPGGTLALFWNHPFAASADDPIHLAMQEVYARHWPTDRDVLVEFDGSTCAGYAATLAAYGFGDVATHLYRGTRAFSARDYLSLLNTYSDHRALAPDVQSALYGEIEAVIDAHGGTIGLRDTMDLYLARKP